MNWFRRRYSPLGFAISTGLLLSATTLFVHIYLARFEYSYGLAPGVILQVWIVAGSISAFTSARYHVVSPVLIAIGIYGWTLMTSWSGMVESAQSSGAGLTPTLFNLVVPFWFLPLITGLIVAGIEYGLRHLLNSNL